MKWYDFILLFGVVITLIGVVIFVSIAPLERNSPGLPILLLGIIVMTYGFILRVFNKVFKKDKIFVLGGLTI